MVMAGAVCLFFGFGFLVLSPLMLVFGLGDSRKRRRWERTPKLTCAELAGHAPARCVVIGEIRAGPAGLHGAALTGGAVVWSRTRVWHRYAVSGDEYSELVWEHTSRGPFSLRDATGSVLVSPALFDADTASSGKLSLPPTERVLDEYHRFDRRSGRHGGPALQPLVDRGLLPRSLIERKGGRSTRAWAVEEVVCCARTSRSAPWPPPPGRRAVWFSNGPAEVRTCSPHERSSSCTPRGRRTPATSTSAPSGFLSSARAVARRLAAGDRLAGQHRLGPAG